MFQNTTEAPRVELWFKRLAIGHFVRCSVLEAKTSIQVKTSELFYRSKLKVIPEGNIVGTDYHHGKRFQT